VPVNVIIALVLVIPAYWIIGLRRDGLSFLFFLLVCVGVVFTFDSVLYLVAIVAKSVDVAFALGNFNQAMAIMFCGVFVPVYVMPAVFQWIYFVSPFSYAFGAVALNQFQGTEDEWFLGVVGVALRDKWGNLFVLYGMGVAWRVAGYIVMMSAHRRAQAYQLMDDGRALGSPASSTLSLKGVEV